MKRISSNRKAVSNVLGYVFSFSIIALIMTSQMIFLATTQDKKSHEVAAFEAQNVANQVADALVRAVLVSQSMPDSHYYDVLDLPAKLAGYDYGISIDENAVYVQTKDGVVSKSCLNYNAKNLAFDIRGEISSGEGEVVVTYTPPNFVYKLDFGTGDDPDYSVSHSPVKSGYYMVTNDLTIAPDERRPPWWKDNPMNNDNIGDEKCNFKHRIPLLIDNTGGEDLINVPVKIVLSSEDVDLDKIFYTFGTDYLNCDFYDHALSEVIEADLDDNGNSVIEAPPFRKLKVGDIYKWCTWLAGQYMDTELEGFRDFIFDDSNGNDGYDDGELIVGNPSGAITYYDYAKIGITIDGGIFIWDDVDGDGVYGEDEYVLDILDGASATGGNLALTKKGGIGVIVNEAVIGNEYYVYIDENLNGAYDAGRRLLACIDYDKTAVLTETIEGSGEEILTRKGNIVFLVNVNILAGDSKYIYLYYGSTRGSTQDSNYREYFDWDFDASSIALFFDEFSSPYLEWPRKYPRGDGLDEVAYSVASDSCNFIYVVGSGENLADDNTGLDWWIKKFDVNGYEPDESDGWKDKEGLIFDRVGRDDEALCVTTYGTDVYVVGYTTNADRDWCIKKFDRYGNEYGDLGEGLGWNKIFDSENGDDEAKSVAVDGDGNVYVAGYVTTIIGDDNIWNKDWCIKKFNSGGVEVPDPEWDKRFDGIGSNLDDVAYSIAIDNSRYYISGTPTNGNNDVYVVGYATGDDGFKDWWIKKFSSDGIEDLGWNMVLDGIGSGDAEAYSVTIDLDDKDNEDELYVYVAGYVTTADGDKDWCIKKFDKDANPVAGWDNMVFGETDDDVAYTIAVDYYSYNVDWRYYYRSGSATGDRWINRDPDGDNWYASPPNGGYGGLYALDESSEPYTFKDEVGGTEWVYDAGIDTIISLDPDGDGTNADTTTGDFKGGLYALNESSEPYTFKDEVGGTEWVYDAGIDTIISLDPDGDGTNADTTTGDFKGGLYALDDHNTPRPYTFKDEINDEFVYVVGYKTGGADKDWWIQKFNPDGVQEWEWDSIYYYNGEAWSIAIDSYRRIYIAGYGTNLGVGTGSDWWIEKWNYDKSNPSGTLINTERWSLPYSWQYSAACTENEGRSEGDLARLRYYGYLISKDFQIPPLDDDIYIVEMKAHLGPSSYYYLDPYHSHFYTTSMILLSQSRENYDESYVVTARNYPDYTDYPDKISSEFTLRKSTSSGSIETEDAQDMSFLKSAGVDGEGLIMRSYVYKDAATATATNINSYLYHPNTFVPYSHSISGSDDTAPFTFGRIGLLPDHWSYFYVDWIRVLKSTKNPPTVTIGAMEPLNFGWEWPSSPNHGAEDLNTGTFCTDPLYYDFINVPMTGWDGTTDPDECSKFYIYHLLPGKYAITLTMGDTDGMTEECHLVYSCRDEDESDFTFASDPVQLPLTDIGQFKRAWFTVDGMEIENYIDICLVFYGASDEFKPISSLTIDRLLLSEYGIALLRGTKWYE